MSPTGQFGAAELFLSATLLPAAKLKQPWWDLIPATIAADEAAGRVTFWQARDEWLKLRALKSENASTRNANESPGGQAPAAVLRPHRPQPVN